MNLINRIERLEDALKTQRDLLVWIEPGNDGQIPENAVAIGWLQSDDTEQSTATPIGQRRQP